MIIQPGSYLTEQRNFFSIGNAGGVTTLFNNVLRGSGAVAPERDRVDRRIVNEVRNRSGRIVDRVSDTNGYPAYEAGQPSPDGDGDGMPDEWERNHGLNPGDASDATGDRNGDGYTNVEEYLNNQVPDRAFP